MVDENRDEGQSRRDLLKKGAIVGAVAWTAPMIISSPAFAATAQCSGSVPCTNFFFVKVNGDGSVTSGVGDGSCGTRTIKQCNNTNATLQDGGGHIASSSGNGNLLTIKLTAGTVPILVTAKYGANCHDYTYNENTKTFSAPSPATLCTASVTTSGTVAGGLTIIIASNGSGCGISHVNLYFCS